MKIPVIQFKQNDQTFFIFLMAAKTIYSRFDVSRRIDDKEKGYQRSFSATRIKQIARYIDKENGILPNSILVNLDIGKYSYSAKEKTLTLKTGTLGFIIDGQHRVWGANEATADIDLPVVATAGLENVDQAKLFVKINQTQKGVPASLYLDLLDLTDGAIEDFDDESVPANRRAVEIAKRLNEDEESPLFETIRTTGDSGRGVSLSEFVNQAKEYVDPKSGKLLNYGFEQQLAIFKIYFKAVKAVFLEQWEDEKSLILKTVGFGGLMRAFYEIFQLASQSAKSFSTENTIKLLALIKDFKFDSATLPGGGIKAQDNAAKVIVASIKKELKSNDDLNVPIVE